VTSARAGQPGLSMTQGNTCMSISFRILNAHGLVYVRYDGLTCPVETSKAFQVFMQDPDFKPGLKHLIDLSRTTGINPDYLNMIKLQAQKVDAFMQGQGQTLVAYYAPTEVAFEVAVLASRSWEGSLRVATVVHRREAEVLEFLGIREPSIEALLTRSAAATSDDS
jgi:hypothetical protein